MKKKKPIAKRPVGRPTNYKPEYCQIAIDALTNGDTVERVAFLCGDVFKQTLYEWARDYPDFGDALNKGRQAARMYWLQVGNRAVESRSPFREGMFKWIMAVRFGIREKQEVVATTTNLNTNVETTPEELEAIVAAAKLQASFRS